MRLAILGMILVSICLGACGQAPKEESTAEPLRLVPRIAAHCGQQVVEMQLPPLVMLMTESGQVVLQNGVHTFGDCSFEVRSGRVYDLN